MIRPSGESKTPVYLFLLPAWLDHVPGMQFVGVIRNPGSIAKSIIKRDDLPEEFAHDLVAAYIERLADLHRRFEFPIIDFGDEDAAVLGRTQAVAEAAGMPWDDESARKFFSPSLIHHKSTQSPDPNYHYLLEQAARPVGELKTYDAETIGEALSDVTSERASLLPTSYGLRFKERRRALWNEILHDPELESVIDLVPGHADKTFLNPKDLEFVTLASVGTGASVPRQLKGAVPATHVLGTGVIPSLAPDDFNKLLIDLDQKTQIEATAVFDGLRVGTSPLDWEAAVHSTAWTVDEVRSGPHGDVLVLYKSAATVDGDREPTTTERHLLNLDARLTALERTASARRETYAKRKAASATDGRGRATRQTRRGATGAGYSQSPLRAAGRPARRESGAENSRSCCWALPVAPPPVVVDLVNQGELAAAMSDRRPAQGRLDGPTVSIVVVTRNGAHHLRRLFAGLRDNTTYRKFEVIVVDNGSEDDSVAVLGKDWGFRSRSSITTRIPPFRSPTIRVLRRPPVS